MRAGSTRASALLGILCAPTRWYNLAYRMVRSPAEPGGLDGEVAAQLEGIIRRVKHSMNYRGSYSTRDILGSLVARWVHSGEWERLKQLPASERHLGESVRRFILDRLDQLQR